MTCPEYAWVCWSTAQYVRDRSKTITHVQGEDEKTLCGIPYGPMWDFEVHDNYEAVSCRRCVACLGRAKLEIP